MGNAVYIVGGLAWLSAGSVPMLVELNRGPVDHVRDALILMVMMILGPLGLLIWFIAEMGLDDD